MAALSITEIKQRWITRWPSGLGGGMLCAGVGCLFLALPPLGGWLDALSFDLPYAWRQGAAPPEAVIVSMDEWGQKELMGHSQGVWSPAWHGRLIEKAFGLGAAGVVFDVLFEEPRQDAVGDAQFLKALQEARGGVVLGATLEQRSGGDTSWDELRPPARIFSEQAAWGLIDLPQDSDHVMRRHFWHPNPEYISLAGRAAALLDKALPEPDRPRWIQYYGPRGSVSSISYTRLLEQPDSAAGVFAGKVLFVGWHPTRADGVDEHRTPYQRWTGESTTGVEIHATIFLNLLHGHALFRMARVPEVLLVVGFGLALGYLGGVMRPWTGLGLGLGLFVGLTVLVWELFWRSHLWFAWLVPGAVQIPVAVFWSCLMHWRHVGREMERLGTAGVGEMAGGDLGSGGSGRRMPSVPDHELIRCIGRGAYGEVWLARDVIGTYHAVKVVYRNVFTEETPFEREFRGIQKFTPLSRLHPGWVHILHVGRHDAEGYFYYVMELGDDVKEGQTIDPERYQARTLATDLAQRGPLPIAECLRLGASLAASLQHLHDHGLIHRDIKPSNVIYVHGQPKFADIGLVTEIAGDRDVSRLGTEGYMAPEGPGTTAADLFSLGKLLYEAGLGRDPRAFPEMPTAMFDQADDAPQHRLHTIVLKACAQDPALRHAQALELKADLDQLLSQLP